MSRKPDGKPAKTERVTFTRPAAERIAKVVRTVEAGDRDQPGITFGSAMVAPRTFRMATFTGAWSINGTKTVTLRGSTATLSAVNLFLNLPDNGQRNCAVAKDGTAWNLIQWQWNEADVMTGASLGTAHLEFTRVKSVSLATATTVRISITTCSTAAT
jgi:hypothetical protein